jgi:ABC-type transporter Mla maintaining outer membrane lipid asymmetry permease subunit MlaE
MIDVIKGFNAENGTASVGQAVNSAVVIGSLTIFIIDMLAVQLTTFFLKWSKQHYTSVLKKKNLLSKLSGL